jgi:transcriptional regulator with XRE-family HTH domain
MMDELDELPKLLKDLRLQRGWEHKDVMAHSGVHRTNVADYERGEAMPGIRNLARIADAYGFTASDLLDEINL